MYDASMNSPRTADPVDKPRRKYNSTRRSLQAAQTRDDVLAAAIRLFSSAGWAGTTIAGIAADAGVAVETIYSGFGSKKALLRAAMDVAVVGDADPIPFVEREEARRLGDGTIDERLQWGVTVVTNTHERSAGVWRAIVEASIADAEIDRWRVELDAGRRIEIERSFRVIFGEDLDAMTNDLLWVVLGPEVYLRLTGDLSLSREQYETYILTAIVRLAQRSITTGKARSVVGASVDKKPRRT